MRFYSCCVQSLVQTLFLFLFWLFEKCQCIVQGKSTGPCLAASNCSQLETCILGLNLLRDLRPCSPITVGPTLGHPANCFHSASRYDGGAISQEFPLKNTESHGETKHWFMYNSTCILVDMSYSLNFCIGLLILQELRLLYIILSSFKGQYFQNVILPRKFPHPSLTFKQFHIPAGLTDGITWHYYNIYSVIFNLFEYLTLFVVPTQLTIILEPQGHLSAIFYFVHYLFIIRKEALFFLYILWK